MVDVEVELKVAEVKEAVEVEVEVAEAEMEAELVEVKMAVEKVAVEQAAVEQAAVGWVTGIRHEARRGRGLPILPTLKVSNPIICWPSHSPMCLRPVRPYVPS